MKITFLGGGNMANALIGGLRKQGYSAAGIQVVEPVAELRDKLTDTYGVRCVDQVDAAALNCEVLVLAVKPQVMKSALAPISGKLNDQLIISIAAGLRMDVLARWLGSAAAPYRKIVRTMPNTPALVGAGITGLCADASVDNESRDTAEKIISAVGGSLWVSDEAKMDAVTAISGSGPGYVFYFIEALEKAATDLGFDAATARLLAVETFVGSAKLAASTDDPVSLLRERVTSKGGTTAAALDSFAADGVAQAIIKGALAAEARGKELCDILGAE